MSVPLFACKPAVQLLHHSCLSPSKVLSLSSFFLVPGVWQGMQALGLRSRDSRMSWQGGWEELHLGMACSAVFVCCGRVQHRTGSLLTGHLMVSCLARAPWGSAGCHPLLRVGHGSVSILVSTIHSHVSACKGQGMSSWPCQPHATTFRLSLCDGQAGAWRLAWLLHRCSSKR